MIGSQRISSRLSRRTLDLDVGLCVRRAAVSTSARNPTWPCADRKEISRAPLTTAISLKQHQTFKCKKRLQASRLPLSIGPVRDKLTSRLVCRDHAPLISLSNGLGRCLNYASSSWPWLGKRQRQAGQGPIQTLLLHSSCVKVTLLSSQASPRSATSR